MMDIGQRKEQFSRAYVHAVASVAGYSMSVPPVDDDSVDLMLAGRSVDGIPCRPRLEMQLKCTSGDVLRDDQILYSLRRKNYDELKITDLLVPRLLVVVLVPESEEDWIRHGEDEMAIRRCGYWVSLRGRPATTNAYSVAVHLPRSQVFDVEGLRGLMGRASRKEPL